MKNYGFSPTTEKLELRGDEWQFGALSIPCLFAIPEHRRLEFLPIGEIQRSATDDMMDCVTRAYINTLEAKLTYAYQTGIMSAENRQWFRDHGYVQNNRIVLSDAFTAILSGTTRQGNSLKAPVDALRKYGFIPKSMLPLESWMSFEDYHNPKRITQAMKLLGEEAALRIEMHYEQVNAVHFSEVLKEDFVVGGVFAWPTPKNGEYPRTDEPFNHVVALFANPKYTIFDNYLDTDGDFIKKLAPDYRVFDHGYRLYINKERTGAEVKAQRDTLFNIFREILTLMGKLLAKMGGYVGAA